MLESAWWFESLKRDPSYRNKFRLFLGVKVTKTEMIVIVCVPNSDKNTKNNGKM